MVFVVKEILVFIDEVDVLYYVVVNLKFILVKVMEEGFIDVFKEKFIVLVGVDVEVKLRVLLIVFEFE